MGQQQAFKLHSSCGKVLLTAVFACLLAIVTAVLPATAAFAAQDVAEGDLGASGIAQAGEPTLMDEILWTGFNDTWVTFINMPTNAVFVKAVSSNTSVLELDSSSQSLWGIQLKPLKPGTSTVAVTYKVGTAKKTVKGTYTVKKYPNPFKKIELSGKSVAVPTAANHLLRTNLFNFKGTMSSIKVTCAPGWDVSYMSLQQYDPSGDNWTSEAIENGKRFSVAKDKNATIIITVCDSAGNYLSHRVGLFRAGPITLRANPSLYAGMVFSPWLFGQDLDLEKSIKVLKVTSSDPAVLAPEKVKARYSGTFLRAKKAGKSTVTLSYSYKGKKYTTSALLSVHKYPNAVKALQVNGKKVAVNAKKNAFSYYLGAYGKAKAKSKLVPGKGWRITGITYHNEKSKVSKKVKNGANVSIPKKGVAGVEYTLRNNVGLVFYYNVAFKRS